MVKIINTEPVGNKFRKHFLKNKDQIGTCLLCSLRGEPFAFGSTSRHNHHASRHNHHALYGAGASAKEGD